MRVAIWHGMVCLSSLWLLASALPAARADAAFQVRCQYVRYGRAYNAADLPALGALLTPGCSVVENYGARPWPLLSDVRLYLSRYGRSLQIRVVRVRVSGDRAAVIADEDYRPRPGVVSRRFRRRVNGFHRERRDVWMRIGEQWRLSGVQVLGSGWSPSA